LLGGGRKEEGGKEITLPLSDETFRDRSLVANSNDRKTDSLPEGKEKKRNVEKKTKQNKGIFAIMTRSRCNAMFVPGQRGEGNGGRTYRKGKKGSAKLLKARSDFYCRESYHLAGA